MIKQNSSLGLLTTEDVCQLLKISKRTAQSYRDRKILGFIQCGRKILYQESDIQAFLDAHHIVTPFNTVKQ